jgi:anti-sigma-K factor RskA
MAGGLRLRGARVTEDEKPAAYSGAWYRQLSDEELQIRLGQSMVGSPVHDGASAETERRENVRDKAEQMRWTRRTFWAAVILGTLSIVATIAVALVQA